jgi:exopolysaccharide production protein ExoY
MNTMVDIDTGILRPRPLGPRRSHARGPVATPRLFDLLIAGGALLFLLPLFFVIVAAIRMSDRGPAFFSHQRLGKGGRAFGCLKFRTMVTDADVRLAHLLQTDLAARAEWESTQKLTRDPRVTPLGRFLRSSSLDELPQLLNVLRGEMSLVGPRPIVAAERPFYGRRFESYARVRPGISGLWQISGRSDTSYRRRVACDVLYVRRRGLVTDLKVLVLTIPAVLAARGAR